MGGTIKAEEQLLRITVPRSQPWDDLVNEGTGPRTIFHINARLAVPQLLDKAAMKPYDMCFSKYTLQLSRVKPTPFLYMATAL